jgi:plastocyanin
LARAPRDRARRRDTRAATAGGSEFAHDRNEEALMTLRFGCAMLLLTLSVACSSSNNTPSTPTGAMQVSIVTGSSTLTTNAYSPNPLTVPVGSTVTWVNNDSTAHTSTDDDANGWNSGTIAPGGQFSRAFQTAGTFSYHCSFHRNMVGTVRVQ